MTKSASDLPRQALPSNKKIRIRSCSPASQPTQRLERPVGRKARYPDPTAIILTVGHSTRTLKDFVALLLARGVEQLIDVRSIPRSRHNPQFNRDRLSRPLQKVGVVTSIWLGSSGCGMLVVTRSMLVGKMPAFAASLITCRHQNFKRRWISSSTWLKNGDRQSCEPKLCPGDATAH